MIQALTTKMKENKHAGIFIPGRLSSERLPNKLILPLGNTCLWDMACRKLSEIDSSVNKYVLCHDPILIDIASKYKNLNIVVRDIETTKVDGPLTFIFKDLNSLDDTHLMFLNPCLSQLKANTIESSLQRFNSSVFEYATSVKKYKNWLWNKNKINLTPIDYQSLSTKTIPIHYEAAHCFHIFNKKEFFNTGNMLVENLDLIEVSEDELIDVDTNKDYMFLRWYIEQRQ